MNERIAVPPKPPAPTPASSKPAGTSASRGTTSAAAGSPSRTPAASESRRGPAPAPVREREFNDAKQSAWDEEPEEAGDEEEVTPARPGAARTFGNDDDEDYDEEDETEPYGRETIETEYDEDEY
ncbi:MAG TPA: hypothetical protein VM557_11525 [Thermoanaerobaculia bacterium]|nr:hypothetical protein [Thermoanaerobaculia bacterium]